MNKSISFIIFFLGFFAVFAGGTLFLNTTVLAPNAPLQQSSVNSDGTVAAESTSAADVQAETTPVATYTATVLVTPAPSVAPIPVQETPAPTQVSVPQANSSSLLGVVNNYRASNGKTSFAPHGGLCSYLQTRESGIRSGIHSNLNSEVFAAYCPECTNLAENIARGYSSDAEVLAAWLASGSHRENIEGDWTYGCTIRFGDAAAMMFGR